MNKALFQMTPFPSSNHRQDNDVVLSSRIRLARNLKAYPFPHQMDRESAYKYGKKSLIFAKTVVLIFIILMDFQP